MVPGHFITGNLKVIHCKIPQTKEKHQKETKKGYNTHF